MDKIQENYPHKARPEHTVNDGIDFQKLIVPWSFKALDLQNLKFSAPESRPRAHTRRRNVRLNEHAPPSDLTRRTSFKRVDGPHVPHMSHVPHASSAM